MRDLIKIELLKLRATDRIEKIFTLILYLMAFLTLYISMPFVLLNLSKEILYLLFFIIGISIPIISINFIDKEEVIYISYLVDKKRGKCYFFNELIFNVLLISFLFMFPVTLSFQDNLKIYFFFLLGIFIFNCIYGNRFKLKKYVILDIAMLLFCLFCVTMTNIYTLLSFLFMVLLNSHILYKFIINDDKDILFLFNNTKIEKKHSNFKIKKKNLFLQKEIYLQKQYPIYTIFMIVVTILSIVVIYLYHDYVPIVYILLFITVMFNDTYVLNSIGLESLTIDWLKTSRISIDLLIKKKMQYYYILNNILLLLVYTVFSYMTKNFQIHFFVRYFVFNTTIYLFVFYLSLLFYENKNTYYKVPKVIIYVEMIIIAAFSLVFINFKTSIASNIFNIIVSIYFIKKIKKEVKNDFKYK